MGGSAWEGTPQFMVMSVPLAKDITAVKPLCKDRSLWFRPQEGLLHKLSSGRNTDASTSLEVSKGSVGFQGCYGRQGLEESPLSPSSWVKNRKLPSAQELGDSGAPAFRASSALPACGLLALAALWALETAI